MAQRISTFLVDDIDGTRSGVRTVEFMLDGQGYSIDLSGANAARLRAVLEPYVVASLGRGRRRMAKTPKAVYYGGEPDYLPTKATLAIKPIPADLGYTLKDVRAWARGAGHYVPDIGSLRAEVVAAFMAAHEKKRRRRSKQWL